MAASQKQKPGLRENIRSEFFDFSADRLIQKNNKLGTYGSGTQRLVPLDSWPFFEG